jgi:ATP-NAD kinase N-terminal domain
VGIVGVIVNPLAGKDVRRLVTAASHTSDAVKIGIVRRAVIAALECGATRVLLADDPHHLAARAVDGLGSAASVGDGPLTGSRLDSSAAAAWLRDEGAGVVIALGGDGTCRDVAIGWPDVPLVAISTGTNNAFPLAVDGTAAGCAAGLVASGAVARCAVARRSKRLVVEGSSFTEIALVDVALVAASFVGSRAVTDPAAVLAVVACMAAPSATGLSAIAGRAHPVDRWSPGGVAIRLGDGGRAVRAPIGPGAFATVHVSSVTPLADGESVRIDGPGVVAYDGERDRRLAPGEGVTVTVSSTGPLLVDVDLTLRLAAERKLFDVCPSPAEEC